MDSSNSVGSGLNIEVHDDMFSSPDAIFETLEEEIKYLPSEKTYVYVKGILRKVPRQIAAYGSPGLHYAFSGLNVVCEPWTPLLVNIKNKVEEICGCSFNFVLINRYKDGEDCIGQHKDNEYELAKDHPIASVSFGETRKMIFKRPDFDDFSINIKDNSLLIMKSPTNRLWSHGIPREKDRKGVRINLTFRGIAMSRKRKADEKVLEASKSKRKEYMNSQSRGFLNMNDPPEGIYPVGDNVFLCRNVYLRNTIVHLRRYRCYGQSFYPTKEGITMDIHEFDILMRSAVPEHLGQLFEVDDRLGYSIDISALGENKFKLTKYYDRPEGKETTTSIVISSTQWQEMKNHHDILMELLIRDKMSKVAFNEMFLTWSKVCHFEGELLQSIPESWDVKLGTNHITNMIKTIIMDLLVEKGNLIMPENGIGEIGSSNEIKDFNSAVKDLNMQSVVQIFYDKVTQQNVIEDFLLRKVSDYVTIDFINFIDFPELICEVRRKMCPSVGMMNYCV